jgi:hypothetical protein
LLHAQAATEGIDEVLAGDQVLDKSETSRRRQLATRRRRREAKREAERRADARLLPVRVPRGVLAVKQIARVVRTSSLTSIPGPRTGGQPTVVRFPP